MFLLRWFYCFSNWSNFMFCSLKKIPSERSDLQTLTVSSHSSHCSQCIHWKIWNLSWAYLFVCICVNIIDIITLVCIRILFSTNIQLQELHDCCKLANVAVMHQTIHSIIWNGSNITCDFFPKTILDLIPVLPF